MKELRPRLTAAGRLLLVFYALLALAVSAWALRTFAWPAIAILAPLTLALTMQDRQRTPPAADWESAPPARAAVWFAGRFIGLRSNHPFRSATLPAASPHKPK